MNDKNQDAFLMSIKGTTPIKKNNKIKHPTPKRKIHNFIKKEIDLKTKTKNPKKLTQNKNPSFFEIQKTPINKKLKRGKIPIDRKIDFHGFSVLDAELLFSNSIKELYQKNLRCILFITGKGFLKKENEDIDNIKLYYGKIRNNFINWTKKKELQKYILNVEQASIEYGADGAFFVYLRKKTKL
jgi:DNA-nicking Smr family endonuclease